MPFLYADALKCTGCRICEIYCSLHKEGALNPMKARIRVVRMEPGVDKPVSCRQCADPPCAEACPGGAISRDAKADLVSIDEAKCTGCGACVEACPFGAIFIHPERGVAIKCDLCGFCIDRCPPKVLRILTPAQLAELRGREFVGRMKPVILGRIPLPRAKDA